MGRGRTGPSSVVTGRGRQVPAALALAVAVLLVAAGCAAGTSVGSTGVVDPTRGTAPPPTTVPLSAYAGYTSEVYSGATNWLCRPDTPGDPCHRDLDATVVQADGSTSIERWQADPDAPVDCFYVYPTVSMDAGTNSDRVPYRDSEVAAVRGQAARLGSRCRVFAPVYRQVTVPTLKRVLAANGAADLLWVEGAEVAYTDVLDAFKQYIAHDNGGRGFVLVGHSQGSQLLARLVHREIEANAELRNHLVSAFLPGVPSGLDLPEVTLPACTQPSQTGCVVAWSTFRATSPPPADSIFGLVRGPLGCVNPAALGGGSPVLDPYFPAARTNALSRLFGVEVPMPEPWLPADHPITTPFVRVPDFVRGECRVTNGFSELSVSVVPHPGNPRAADLDSDLTPDWGLHLLDLQIVQGDLLDLVGRQAAAYTGR